MATVQDIKDKCADIAEKIGKLQLGGATEEELQAKYDEGFADGRNYKALAFTSSLTVTSTKAFEKGATCTSVSFSWKLNKTPTSLSISGGGVTKPLANTATSTTITGTFTADTVWTLTAKFEDTDNNISEQVSRDAGIYFYDTVYYGCSTEPIGDDGNPDYTSAWILGLTDALSDSHISFTTDPEDDEYRYYCVPTAWDDDTKTTGKIIFDPDQGINTFFERFHISEHTNESGCKVGGYTIYRSMSPGGSERTFKPIAYVSGG